MTKSTSFKPKESIYLGPSCPCTPQMGKLKSPKGIHKELPASILARILRKSGCPVLSKPFCSPKAQGRGRFSSGEVHKWAILHAATGVLQSEILHMRSEFTKHPRVFLTHCKKSVFVTAGALV